MFTLNSEVSLLEQPVVQIENRVIDELPFRLENGVSQKFDIRVLNFDIEVLNSDIELLNSYIGMIN